MNQTLLIPVLLELLAKSALLLLAATAVLAVARRLSAAQHHALWMAAFAALLLLPFTKCIPPHWHLPGSPVAPVVTVLPAMPAVMVDRVAIGTKAAPPPPKTFHLPDVRHLVIAIWLTGAAAIVAYRLLGGLQIAWLRRCTTPGDSARLMALARQAASEMNLRAPCPIRLAEAARVPCTWGVWRPVVLLPAAAENAWPEARLLAALRHEFAHVSRRDYLSRWVALLTCALYWPSPLVWFAARRLCIAQEQACDDLVLTAGTPPADYAALLVETARASLGAASTWRAAVAMARPSTLEGRVLAIVDETRNRRAASRATGLLGALGIAAIIGASAIAQIAPEKSLPPPGEADAKTQILISAKFIEVDKSAITDIAPPGTQISGVWTREQATAKWAALEAAHAMEVLSSPVVTVISGHSASMQVGREYDLPPGSQPPPKFVGTTVEVTPTAGDVSVDVDIIVQQAALKAEATTAAGKPVFADHKVHVAYSVFDQSTVGIWLGPAQKEGRELCLLIEATMDDPTLTQARKIIFPKLEIRKAPLPQVLEILRTKAAELDPDKSGLKILLEPGTESAASIDLTGTEMSLATALFSISAQTQLELHAEPNALVLRTFKRRPMPNR